MKKTLILVDDWYYDFHLKSSVKDEFDLYPMLKGNIKNKILRAIRKFHLSSCLPFKSIWIDEHIKKINQYGKVIFCDAGNTFNVVHYLRKRNENIRIIVWYRNSYNVSAKMKSYSKLECEIWSFDKNDCLKYGFLYNPQFLISIHKINKNKEKKIDTFFIGRDKGRKEELLHLKNIIESLGLSASINIVDYNSSEMSYEEVLKKIEISKCIIDYQCDWQEGITLRPLEALVYGKKLITNNKSIRNMDYYNKNNIFIIGYDSFKDLKKFINSPMTKIDEKIINRYTILGWLKVFDEKKEI